MDKDDRRYGAAFGLNKALSLLLKIDVSGDRARQKEETAGIQRNEERVHTPLSILQKLRVILRNENKISDIDDKYMPEPRHTVEFSAFLRRNPLIQIMDAFVGLIDMAIIFREEHKPPHKGIKPLENEYIKMKKQMQKFLEGLKAGDTVDIVSDTLACKYRAVITLEREYLNDPTMADLVDGQFNVIGKIIRVIPDTENSINLLRKTALSAMPQPLLKDSLSHLSNLGKNEAFSIPNIEWEIKGPVIHVLPIAIFV